MRGIIHTIEAITDGDPLWYHSEDPPKSPCVLLQSVLFQGERHQFFETPKELTIFVDSLWKAGVEAFGEDEMETAEVFRLMNLSPDEEEAARATVEKQPGAEE